MLEWRMPRRRRTRLPKGLRTLGDVALFLLVLLLMPVGLVLVLVTEPFRERRERLRPCPNCGLRGTLRDITPPPPPLPEDEDFWLIRRRIVRTRLWRCELCEAEFGERDGGLVRHVPPREAAA